MNVADLVDRNDPAGRTYREVNTARVHAISIGTLVEFKSEQWHGDGACTLTHARLWVVAHARDCDGEPLYTVSRWRDPDVALMHPFVGDAISGLDEESLTPITLTDGLRYGDGALTWDGAEEKR